MTTEIGNKVCVCRCLAAYHSVSVCGGVFVSVCERGQLQRGRERWWWGRTGIKGFAAMNVILIKPSRILRFSL